MIECVPNFSAGRDSATIDAIARAVQAAGAKLLDRTSDPDHNRSVLTLAGNPEQVFEAAFAAIRVAAQRINISRHTGVHPRTGAADVIPFVPLGKETLEDCASLAHQLGQRVVQDLRIPVYFYEAAAQRPECVRLESVRRNLQKLPPDLGAGSHPTAGVCIIGARRTLIAWNINLRTHHLQAAREIAAAIRESSGGFPGVKALGLPLPTRNQVQVSMNLVDYERTPLYRVFNRVEEICRERAIEIEGSELIGLIPQAALDQSAGHDLCWLNLTPRSVLENLL